MTRRILIVLITVFTAAINQVHSDCEGLYCPASNCSEYSLNLPHPYQCNAFCKCIKGVPHYNTCPDGLLFNIQLEMCDFPKYVQCPLNGCDKVTSCPADNSGTNLHLPNPDDCSSFCKCNWGKAYLVNCQEGLHFNAELQICDWPDQAKCTVNPLLSSGQISTPATQFNSTTPAIDSNSTPATNPHPEPTMPPGQNGCVNVTSCPTENEENPLYVPNPNDCASFCMCDKGEAIYFPCPIGLHFNAELQVCDWPGHANCIVNPLPDSSNPPSATQSNSIFNTTPATNSNSISPSDIKSSPDPVASLEENGCEKVTSCPAENGEFALHLPNPNDCGSFCKCDWGKAIYFSCPHGLHFNAELQVCDWPQSANCIVNPLPLNQSSTSVTNANSTAHTIPTADVSPELTTLLAQNGCEKVTCPEENGEFALHLPNPNDCGSFCKCDWGKSIYFSCPHGLHFNAELQVCDWPQSANCIVNPLPLNQSSTSVTNANSTAHTIPTADVSPELTTLPAQNGCEKVTCPAENGEFALHLPNPDDCGSFCKCDWGKAIYFQCPDGLHFYPQLQVCLSSQYTTCQPILQLV